MNKPFAFLIFIVTLAPEYGHCGLHPSHFGSINQCQPGAENLLRLAGAAYFMTNDPSGNSIVVNSINLNGSLRFSHTVSTNGNGMFGNRASVPNGTAFTDPLFSQNSIIVGDNYLFAVNAGSNSVSMFWINPSNPLIITLVSTHSTLGDFPVALAYSKKLLMLCVVNGGTRNGVQCFTVNARRGLTALPDTSRSLSNHVQQSTPAFGPFGTFSDILFVQDSTQLLVSVKGIPNTDFQGFIASYGVNGRTLSRDPIINRPSGSVAPFAMSIIPETQEKAVLFADPTLGYGVIDLDSGTEVGSQIIPIEGQNASCWSDCSTRINRCYTIDANSNQITESSFIQNGSGTFSQIVGQYPVPGNLIDSRIASLPRFEFLYVLSPSLSAVQVLTLYGPGDAELSYSVPVADDVLEKCGVTLSVGIQGMAVYTPNLKWWY